MRDIKFRAWAHSSKVMFKPSTEDGWDLLQGTLHPLPNTTLMQYTGIKDKNSKEIYEGDVVCYVEDVVVESEGGFNRTEPEGQIGSVEFSNGAYWVNGKEFSFYSYGEQMFLWSELEVIGNIYENPDLLGSLMG